jgi:hypothetical protein
VSAAVYVVLSNATGPQRGGRLPAQGQAAAGALGDRLSAFRAEIRAVPGLQPTRRWNWGRTRGLLYEVSGNRFALLALWNDRGRRSPAAMRRRCAPSALLDRQRGDAQRGAPRALRRAGPPAEPQRPAASSHSRIEV